VATTTAKPKTFRGRVEGAVAGRAWIPVPFDPANAWGRRDRWHVAGTIDGKKYRGIVEPGGGNHIMMLGPAWRRDNGTAPGDLVRVVMAIEGPQRETLAPDVARALKANPAAARFWDSVAQFYRKGYLRWIDATKKRPDERARRIAEVVRLLAAGCKQR